MADRQFLVIDASTGSESKVGDVGGLSHGVFQGVPAFDDHRFRQMVLSGSTYSETSLLRWAEKMLSQKLVTVEDAVKLIRPKGWIVLEFLIEGESHG
jgi:hypothetical protein